jgi:NADPH:quinone reductase-like Zn-dependent oxidoreductase
MRAAFFRQHGGPDVLEVGEVPTPEPGPGEVRLSVGASSLNHLDLWMRRGLPFPIPMPHIGGSDMAGVVEAVGAGTDPALVGRRVVVDPTLDWEWITGARRGGGLPEPRFRVLGEHTQGGFAEFVVVPAANLRHLPDDVSFEVAAASSLATVTAWRALFTRGQLTAGERVLVTGGSGGVSTMAIQLARHAGAEVFALTAGSESVRRLEELGAHRAMDRTRAPVKTLFLEALGSRGVDLIVDSVGAPLWPVLLRALAPGGRLVTYGATAGPEASVDLRHVFWKQLSLLGTTMGSPAEFTRAMEAVFRGEVRPVIHTTVPLEGVRDAHVQLESGHVFGKIVVTP